MVAIFNRCTLRGVAGAFLLMPLLNTYPAYAQTGTQENQTEVVNAQTGRQFDFVINAGPLAQALMLFSRITGIDLIFNGVLDSSALVPELRGNYEVGTALDTLLAGTDLLWRFSDSNSIILYRAQSNNSDGAILLGPVRVEAEGIRQTDERDQVYTAPSSVSIITQRQIERFRGTSVGDIFQGTPGVLIGENRNSGGLDVNIRGMQGQGRVPVLVDGARQETTVWRGYAGVASRSYVDPDLIGGIRIDKGPVMTAEGTGATGGVVSMRTIEANDIIKDDADWGVRFRGALIGNNSGNPPAAGTPAGYALASIGDDGVYRMDCAREDICNQTHPSGRSYALPDSFAPEEGMDRSSLFDFKGHSGSLAVAKRFGWVDLVIAYAERSQGNYYAGKNGPAPYLDLSDQRKLAFYTEVRPVRYGATRFRAEERIVNSNYDSESWLLKGSFYLPAEQALEFSYLRYDSAYGELMPSQLMWFGTIRQTDNSTVLAQTYTLRYRWEPAQYNWADVRFNLWHTRTRSQNVFYYLEGDFANLDYSEETSNIAEFYRRWGGDISNTMRFAFYGNPELSYGLAYQKEDIGPVGNSSDGNNLVALDEDFIRDGARKEFSLFSALQWYLWPTVKLDAGIRYTRFSAEDHKAVSPRQDSVYCVDENADGFCDPVFYENSNSGMAPIISLTWEPLEGIQLYARYAEALRMPSMFESTSGFSANPILDVELLPEHAKNQEIGLNVLRNGLLKKEDKFRFKLAYFRNHNKNYLTRTSVNLWEESLTNSADFFRMRNIDKADFNGVELNLDYDFGWFYTQLGATRYTHIEMCHHGSYRRYDCTDYGIANSYINNMIPPKWHASALLGSRAFSERLDFGVRGTFMGQRTLGQFHDDTSNGFIQVVPWHSYNLLDVFITWRHNDNISVDFNIDNLTDRYYLDALSLGLVPAPGRTAKLSLTLQF